MSDLTLFLIVATGVIVTSVASLVATYRLGLAQGTARENARLRSLYMNRRAAALFELTTGKPLPRTPVSRRRSAWVEEMMGGADA